MGLSTEELFLILIIVLVIAIPVSVRVQRYLTRGRTARLLCEQFGKPTPSNESGGQQTPREQEKG